MSRGSNLKMNFTETASALVSVHADATAVIIEILKISIRARSVLHAIHTHDLHDDNWRSLWHAAREMCKMLDDSIPDFNALEFDTQTIRDLIPDPEKQGKMDQK